MGRNSIANEFRRWPLVALVLLHAAMGCRGEREADLEVARRVLLTNPEMALSVLEKGRTQASSEAHFLRGVALAELKRFGPAVAAFSSAVELEPSARNLAALTRAELLAGDWAAARKTAASAVSKTPMDLPSLLFNAVLVSNEQDRRAGLELLTRYREAIEQLPGAVLPAEVYLAQAGLEQELDGPGSAPALKALAAAQSAPLEDPGGALLLAQAAFATGSRELARALAFRAAAEGLERDAVLRLARLGLELNEQATVHRALEKLALGDPAPEVQRLFGEYNLRENSFGAASEFLTRALEATRDPEQERAIRQPLAAALLGAKRPALALAQYEALRTLEPQNADYLAGYAEAALQSGQPDLVLAELADKTLTDSRLRASQIRALLELDRRAEAVRSARQWLDETSTQRSDALCSWILALTHDGSDSAATQSIVEYLLAQGAEGELSAAAIQQLLRQKKYAAALKLSQLLMSRFPDRPALHILSVEALIADGQLDAAKERLGGLAALPALSTTTELLGSLAEQARKRNDTVLELGVLNVRLAAEPSNLGVRLERAEAFIRLQDMPSAIADYEQLLTELPGDVKVLNNLAALYTEVGRAQDAVPIAEQAFALEPDLAPVQDTLAWALVQRGQPDDLDRAVKLLTTALAVSGDEEVRRHYEAARAVQDGNSISD